MQVATSSFAAQLLAADKSPPLPAAAESDNPVILVQRKSDLRSAPTLGAFLQLIIFGT